MNALIVGSAEVKSSRALLKRLAAEAQLIVAADGGGAACLRAGVIPDFVVGDLDSLPDVEAERLRAAGVEFQTHSAKKDVTDLDLAISAVRARGARHVRATGVLGGRLDHTLASLGSLMDSADLEPVVFEPDLTVWMLAADGRRRLVLENQGSTVSLLALRGAATVTCAGFRYPLADYTLSGLSSRGISNVIEGPSASVSVSDGGLLVVTMPLDGRQMARACTDDANRA